MTINKFNSKKSYIAISIKRWQNYNTSLLLKQIKVEQKSCFWQKHVHMYHYHLKYRALQGDPRLSKCDMEIHPVFSPMIAKYNSEN